MKTTLLAAVSLAFFAFGVSGSPVEQATPTTNVARSTDSGFAASCSNTSFNSGNVVLTTTCRNEAGNSITQSISLNSCIANINGQLVFQVNGNFASTCPNRALITTQLTAECENGSGGNIFSFIELNNVMTNNNGVLTCP